MKSIKRLLGIIAVFSLVFTSCSKEEAGLMPDDEKATLSFSTVLNDLVTNRQALKQQMSEIPECTDDAPAYVHVALTGPNGNVGTMMEPIQIDVNPTPFDEDGDGTAEYFTEESAEMELEPGVYTLNYFAVFNEGGDLIWLAPHDGGTLSNFVDNPLPFEFNLGAGVKKYVDVEVLCFDDRIVNLYGYLFFDIIGREAYTFCVFANYCDENGRHYPAYYSFEVYLGTDDSGELLYSDLYPVPNTDGEDPSVAPLCFALPNPTSLGGDVPYIYWRATLEDWEGVYGEAGDHVLEGTLTRNIIMSLLNDDGETVEYAHLRFNCGQDNGGGNGNGDCDLTDPDADCDDDGVLNGVDQCPETPGAVEWDGCPDSDGDGVHDGIDECPGTAPGTEVDEVGCPVNGGGTDPEPCLAEAPSGCSTTSTSNFVVDSTTFLPVQESWGDISVTFEEGGVRIGVTPVVPYEITHIEARINDEIACVTTEEPGEGGTVLIPGISESDLNFTVEVRANICEVSGD
ncbi:hypothetical protein ACW6QP_05530 [Salegentibacter sp. HM20]